MTATLDKPEQLNFFSAPKPKTTPAPKKKTAKRTGPKPLGRGEFPPVAPPNLAQENALWLTGQRSIELQRGKRYVGFM